MKFLYLDDACLGSTPFSEKMIKRMLAFAQKEDVTHIFISRQEQHDDDHEAFANQCHQLGITVIYSAAPIPWGSEEGTVTDDCLQLPNGTTYYPEPGIAFYGDSELMRIRRMYFHLFLTHEDTNNPDSLEDELSELLHDIMHLHKKTNHYH